MWKIALSVVCFVFLILGAYVGFYDALVSLDEVRVVRESLLEDELYKLDQEIDQLEAMLDAEESFLKTRVLTDDEQADRRAKLAERRERLKKARELRAERKKLIEERRKEIIARRGIITRVVEKVQEVQEETKKELQFTLDWSKRLGEVPTSIVIGVQDKSGRNTQLDQTHINQISGALSLMPDDFVKRLKRITIVYGDPNMLRGMAGFGVLMIKGENLDIFRVLVHEYGHIWDLWQEVKTGTPSVFSHGPYQIPEPDPTVTYYEYAWENNVRRATEDSLAFPSGYGKSIPPEDFAEAFALYVLQGDTFRQWMTENPIMLSKYNYLRNEVFAGKEFDSTVVVGSRQFDVTKMVVNYSDLF